VRTPHISLENLVSPLSSSRKRKRLSLQDSSSDHAIKRRHISETVDGNISSLSGISIHSLSPPQFSSTLIEHGHTSCSQGRGWEYSDNTSLGMKTDVSSKDSSSLVHAIQNLKIMSPAVSLSGHSRIPRFSAGSRILELFEDIIKIIIGVLQLMETPGSPKSSVNDLPYVCGVEKLTTVPKKLTKSPRSPKSP
jgi:hypothetical protein